MVRAKANDTRFKAVHGLAGTRAYKAWSGMIARCSNNTREDFQWYGARGIKVCKRWRNSVLKFVEDMGHPPQGMTLDRINNSGNYEFGNCRWATRKEQARNRASSKFLTFRGRTQTQAEWAEEFGLSQGILYERLHDKWPLEDALLTPIGKQRTNRLPHGNSLIITALGQSKPIKEWAVITGIKHKTIWHRIYQCNWSVEKALTTATIWRGCRSPQRQAAEINKLR